MFSHFEGKRNKLESDRRHAHGTCRKTTPNAQSGDKRSKEEQWRIQGRGPGGQAPSPLFLNQTEARRAEKILPMFIYLFIFFSSRPSDKRGLGGGGPNPRLSKGLDEKIIIIINKHWQNRLAQPKHIGVFDVFLRF